MPVILGTPRQGRMSEHAPQKLIWARIGRGGPALKIELIDVAMLPIGVDDAGEALKDAAFRRARSIVRTHS